MECIVISLMFVFVMWVIRSIRGRHRRARWQTLGEAMGLVYEAPEHTIDWRCPGLLYGEHDGARVTVTTEQRAISRFSSTWTIVTLDHPAPLDVGLMVTPRGVLDSLTAALGGEDIEVGSAGFDDAFRVRAHDPEAALRVLNADARQAMAALAQHKGTLQITDAQVRLAREGVHSDAVQLKAWLDNAHAVSRALVSAAHARTLDAQAVVWVQERARV